VETGLLRHEADRQVDRRSAGRRGEEMRNRLLTTKSTKVNSINISEPFVSFAFFVVKMNFVD
jgi:hypothetical protein